MKNNKYFQYILMAFTIMLLSVSCDSFLDELPDNRTVINDEEQLKKLLVSAYSEFDYSVVTELSSDNVVDNGKEYQSNKFYDETAIWKDVNIANNNSLSSVWRGYYSAISNANQVLEGVKKMQGRNSKELQAIKGEALIARAYAHFMLVNLFSKSYDPKTCDTDLGIPYAFEPETTLNPKYKRGTVKEVYEKINKDIEEALPLIDDNIQEVPKYHFNKDASYAFAAKFNLYYQKWEKAAKYATVVLGSNPEGKLRSWKATTEIKPQSFTPVSMDYVQAENKANLFVRASMSKAALLFGNYNVPIRFVASKRLLQRQGVIVGKNIWDMYKPEKIEQKKVYLDGKEKIVKVKIYPKQWIMNKEFDGKISTPRMYYKFQDTDVVAQIGFTRAVQVRFSTDETLLIRAEALIQQKKYQEALNDINIWTGNFIKSGAYTLKKEVKKYKWEYLNYVNIKKEFTLDEVNEYYDDMPYSQEYELQQKKELHPSFTIEKGTQENLTHYVLQCRRILTIHQGERWFDIRRYGIEVNRYRLNDNGMIILDKLKADDLRKTLQLPQEVIVAGLTPNPR